MLNTECMRFLEKDLEEIIFNSDKKEILKRGLYLPKYLKRQLRIGNYGIADLVGYELSFDDDSWNGKKMNINIYELKQDKISVSAFFQAIRYARGVKSYIEKKHYLKLHNTAINIILIGRSIDLSSDICYLRELISSSAFSISLVTYSYDIDGLNFKNHQGYILTNEGF